MAALAACDGSPLDYDLRGRVGGFSTAPAAQSATSSRPTADARGLISYPSYQVAVAQRGDTVADVANRIGLPAGEIARFNGVQPDDKLRPGEVIALPRRAPDVLPQSEDVAPGGVDIAALAGQAIDTAPLTSDNPGSATPTTIQPRPEPVAPEVQDGPEPVRHKVKRGETAFTISRLYQVPVKSLAEWNGLGSNFAIREGQYLLIPTKDQPAPKRETQPEVAVVTAPGVGSPTPTPPSAVKPLPDEQIEPAAVQPEAKPEVKVPEPTAAPDSAMVYPVQGKIVRTYSKGKNDGIDISGPAGATVRAADAGTVAAITKDSNGIPIIVIRHDPKLLSVYANVDQIEVNKGDAVRRGQSIAALREEATPYVHFEVRNGFDSVDPLPYLN
nr:LysM peptidoglycan-binding domain-containing protein [Tritonibacter litoralis]